MQRTRRLGTVLFVATGVAGTVLARHSPLLVAAFAFLLVAALGRSDMMFMSRTAVARITRRSLRVLVYCPPLLVAGIPFLRFSWPAVVAGATIGALPILFEIRNLRIVFSSAYLSIAEIDATTRSADILYFGLSGVAQEYLYRGIVLAALFNWNRAAAVGVASAAFVGEHLLHRGGMNYWDMHDVAVHCYLGVGLGILVVYTGSLSAAIVGHTVYNLPNLILTFRRPPERRKRDDMVAKDAFEETEKL
jgi:membrane protease YdiL (CAAX protease family)